MTSVAKILGTARQAEIKTALEGGRDRLIEYLAYLVRESEFRLMEETLWAFRKVATYLEDGWQAQQQWTTLAEHCALTMDELGQAMNALVGGTRYEQANAQAMSSAWTAAGEWPTRADLGAFLFFVSVENKGLQPSPSNPGGMHRNLGFSP